jgi:hypothetical protein
VEDELRILSIRHYFSGQHLWAAQHFAKRATDLEADLTTLLERRHEHRSLVIASIVSATAFLEASINELFQDAADGNKFNVTALPEATRNHLTSVWAGFEQENVERWSILAKHQMALLVCDRTSFDPGAEPYQSAKLLITLRNALVHSKPETNEPNGEHRFQKSLRGRFPLSAIPTDAHRPFFPDQCLSAGCANWAVDSAGQFSSQFHSRLGVAPRSS